MRRAARKRPAPADVCTSALAMAVEEVLNQASDLVAVRLEREVTRVEQVDLGCRQITAVWSRPVSQEDGVILTPDDQGWRLIVAKILLEARIQRYVAAVIVKEVELDL